MVLYSQSVTVSPSDSRTRKSQASEQCKTNRAVIVARGTRNVALSRIVTVGELLPTVCTVSCTFATQWQRGVGRALNTFSSILCIIERDSFRTLLQFRPLSISKEELQWMRLYTAFWESDFEHLLAGWRNNPPPPPTSSFNHCWARLLGAPGFMRARESVTAKISAFGVFSAKQLLGNLRSPAPSCSSHLSSLPDINRNIDSPLLPLPPPLPTHRLNRFRTGYI